MHRWIDGLVVRWMRFEWIANVYVHTHTVTRTHMFSTFICTHTYRYTAHTACSYRTSWAAHFHRCISATSPWVPSALIWMCVRMNACDAYMERILIGRVARRMSLVVVLLWGRARVANIACGHVVGWWRFKRTQSLVLCSSSLCIWCSSHI